MFLLLSGRLLHFWLVWWELRLFVLQGWMIVIVDWISCTAVVEGCQLVKGPHLSELPCRACFFLQCICVAASPVSARLFHQCVSSCFTCVCLTVSPLSALIFHLILPGCFTKFCPAVFICVCLVVSPDSALLFHLNDLSSWVKQSSSSSDSADEELSTPEMLVMLILSMVGGGVDHGPVTDSWRGYYTNIHRPIHH